MGSPEFGEPGVAFELLCSMKLVFAQDGRGGEALGGFARDSLAGCRNLGLTSAGTTEMEPGRVSVSATALNSPGTMEIPHGVNFRGDSF